MFEPMPSLPCLTTVLETEHSRVAPYINLRTQQVGGTGLKSDLSHKVCKSIIFGKSKFFGGIETVMGGIKVHFEVVFSFC